MENVFGKLKFEENNIYKRQRNQSKASKMR